MENYFLTRRRFTAGAASLGGALLISQRPATLSAQSASRAEATRLIARPVASTSPATPGLHPLGLREERDALLYIPESSRKFEQAPLLVSLHGATRNADRGIELFRSLSDEHGFLLLAPASAGSTWDAIEGSYGPDVAFINRALTRTFELRTIDRTRIGMAGFSDGASYSLSIGLANGDLFSAVFGFSPGFITGKDRVGKPPVFISHGTLDQILPIEACSRRIVPQLESEGYRVTYREFEGPHRLPPEIAAEAMRWFLA